MNYYQMLSVRVAKYRINYVYIQNALFCSFFFSLFNHFCRFFIYRQVLILLFVVVVRWISDKQNGLCNLN